MKWNIVSDSSCDLFSKIIDVDISISVVPLKIVVGKREFTDDSTLDVNEMMTSLKETKEKSGTACPSPADFATEFEKADNTICVCLTSALSGTHNSAVVAKKIVEEKHPEKNIFVLDTRLAAGAMKLIIDETINKIKENIHFEKVVSDIKDYAKSIKLLFSLSHFDNLIKNGRMPISAAVIASILGLRPIATATPEGTIEVIDKPIGEKLSGKKIVEHILRLKDVNDLPIVISHCNNSDGANHLKNLILKACSPKSVEIIPTRGLCSYYADQRGLIISF